MITRKNDKRTCRSSDQRFERDRKKRVGLVFSIYPIQVRITCSANILFHLANARFRFISVSLHRLCGNAHYTIGINDKCHCEWGERIRRKKKKKQRAHKSDGKIQSAITPKRIQQSNIFDISDCRLPPNLPQCAHTCPKWCAVERKKLLLFLSFSLSADTQHWPFAISVLCSRPAKVLICQVGGKHCIPFDKNRQCTANAVRQKHYPKLCKSRPKVEVEWRRHKWNELTVVLFFWIFICTDRQRVIVTPPNYAKIALAGDILYNLLHQFEIWNNVSKACALWMRTYTGENGFRWKKVN